MIADAIYSFPSLLLAILMAIMISGGQSGLWSGILASGISITVVYIRSISVPFDPRSFESRNPLTLIPLAWWARRHGAS